VTTPASVPFTTTLARSGKFKTFSKSMTRSYPSLSDCPGCGRAFGLIEAHAEVTNTSRPMTAAAA
jgi:hypothetical protein